MTVHPDLEDLGIDVPATTGTSWLNIAVRVGLALVILAGVIVALTACTTVVVNPPSHPVARAAVPSAPSGHPVNPCEVIICGLHPSRIA